MPDEVSLPLRVGLFPSVGRIGRHLIERFTDDSPFRVVAALDASLAAPRVASYGARLVKTLPELLAAEDIDVLWDTSEPGCRLDAGIGGPTHAKHLIVETPLDFTAKSVGQAFACAAQHNRVFLVHHPRRADLDFRQALTVARDPAIGAVRAAKFVSWNYGLPPRGAIHRQAASETSEAIPRTTLRIVAHALDQLVPLMGDRPVSVLATGHPMLFNATDHNAGPSLSLRIAFESGGEGEIDVRLDSPTPFQSGWILTGERGGYAHGRRHTLTEDGEIFDAPVSLSDCEMDADQFHWLAQQIRSGEPNATEEAHLRTVVAVLEAARRSLTSGQVATV